MSFFTIQVKKATGALLPGRRTPRLHHVTVELRAEDVRNCVMFYTEILGLHMVRSPIERTVWFREGVHLYYGGELINMARKPHPRHFALVLGKRYGDVVNQCTDLGLFLEVGTPYWGSPRSYIKDPANNRIELMEFAP